MKSLQALMRERDMHERYSRGCARELHHASRVRELSMQIEQQVAQMPPCSCGCHAWPAEQGSLEQAFHDVSTPQVTAGQKGSFLLT